jgi:hypothetical protein
VEEGAASVAPIYPMKVRLTIHRPITDAAGAQLQGYPGLEVDLASEQAVRLLQAGQAEAVPEVAESAVIQGGEQAVIPASVTPPRKRKG